jgi:hypothetical protein
MSLNSTPTLELSAAFEKAAGVLARDYGAQVTTFLAGVYGFNADEALRQLEFDNIPVAKKTTKSKEPKEKKPRPPSEPKMKLLAEFEELGLTSIDTSVSVAELRKILRAFKKDAKELEKSGEKAATERTRLLKTATGLIPKMKVLSVVAPTEDELDAMPDDELSAFVNETKDALKEHKEAKAAEKAAAAQAKKEAAEAKAAIAAEKKATAEAKKAETAAKKAAAAEKKAAAEAKKAADAEKKAERAAEKQAKIAELMAKIQTHVPDFVAPEDPKIGELKKVLKEHDKQTRPRGRPKKEVSAATDDSDDGESPKQEKPKKKRGRPAKTNKVVESVGNDLIAALVKQAAEASTDEEADVTEQVPTTELPEVTTEMVATTEQVVTELPEVTTEMVTTTEQAQVANTPADELLHDDYDAETDDDDAEEEQFYEWLHDDTTFLKNTPDNEPGFIYINDTQLLLTNPQPYAHWNGTKLCLL